MAGLEACVVTWTPHLIIQVFSVHEGSVYSGTSDCMSSNYVTGVLNDSHSLYPAGRRAR